MINQVIHPTDKRTKFSSCIGQFYLAGHQGDLSGLLSHSSLGNEGWSCT